MKKIIILQNNGGRLANQLWNFACVYGYCLEKEYQCENYSFFRYADYFNFKVSNRLVNFCFFKLSKLFGYKITKVLYYFYSSIVRALSPSRVLVAQKSEFVLPPSAPVNAAHAKLIEKFNSEAGGRRYLCGWLFRNPVAIDKFRSQIKIAFTPTQKYQSNVQNFLNQLRGEYKIIVGVHIRQGDYKNWQGGQYYFTNQEVRKILDDYLMNANKPSNEICFVLCSDGKIDESQFAGLNYRLGPGSEIEDLYVLAGADLIIGSNSTYGGWAAYYGNIPMITFSRNRL